MHRQGLEMKQVRFLCGLMTSCLCVCCAPMAPDWCSAMYRLLIGLACFRFLHVGMKHDVPAQREVEFLFVVSLSFVCMCTCVLALAQFGACINSAFTLMWNTKGVRDVRRDVSSLSDFMQLGGVAPTVCFAVLLLCMQCPWRCGAY